MKQNNIAAVVVTYNRLSLLQECVQRIQSQTRDCDILIVNNASTDSTQKWLDEAQGKGILKAKNTGSNMGGAGGFNYGLRWAVEDGYEFVWMMDDDCFPREDALQRLLEAHILLEGHYGWLSSIALWTDGSECKMNRHKIIKNKNKYNSLLECGIVQATQATFVSLFIQTKTVRRVGLPIKEFFIWGDDIEYTRRIAIREGTPSYIVINSQVIHAMENNNGSSIATDDEQRINRYWYAFRNEAFTYRKEGIKGILYYFAKCSLNIFRIIVIAPDNRLRRIVMLVLGMLKGMLFSPAIEYI